MREDSFFERNKVVSFSIIIACMLFIGIFFIEKSKSVINMIPILRGEVSLGNGFVITTTKNGYPILLKKDDPIVGHQLRFSGNITSTFDDIVFSLSKNAGIIIEIGAHFGYRTINLGKILNGKGKLYVFEPNFIVFSNLRKSIFLNDIDNITTVKNVAISDYNGVCNIEDCLTIQKLSDGKFSKPRSIVVNCNTLDKEMSSENQQIDLLSIDVPDSWFSIIRGASNIINQSPNIVIVVPFYKNQINKEADVELTKLEQNNFNFYICNNGKLQKSSIQKILEQKEAILVITKKQLPSS